MKTTLKTKVGERASPNRILKSFLYEQQQEVQYCANFVSDIPCWKHIKTSETSIRSIDLCICQFVHHAVVAVVRNYKLHTFVVKIDNNWFIWSNCAAKTHAKNRCIWHTCMKKTVKSNWICFKIYNKFLSWASVFSFLRNCLAIKSFESFILKLKKAMGL